MAIGCYSAGEKLHYDPQAEKERQREREQERTREQGRACCTIPRKQKNYAVLVIWLWVYSEKYEENTGTIETS